MQRNKKLVSLVIVAAMLLAILSGCGAKPTSNSSSASSEKPVELVVSIPSFGPGPKNWQEVQDAVSKITLQKINATVKINLTDMSNYGQQFNLLMAGGQNVDLVFVGTMPPTFTGPAMKGQFKPLDKLLDQYGQDIKKLIDPSYLRAGQIYGKQYAIPLLENWAQQNGFSMRKDLVAKYNIDISKVKTAEDMGAVFQIIKDKEPTIVPLAANSMGTVLQQLRWYDQMGDSLGVLPNWDNNLKLVNVYETPEYAKMVKLMRSWYQKGYIQTDAATSTQGSMDVVKAGKAFGMPSGPIPGWATTLKRITGQDMTAVAIGNPTVTTFDVARSMYAIPSISKNPEKAMQLLNLFYSDKDIINLIKAGIEGKDYVKKSEGVIDYPPGVSMENRYNSPLGIGNSFLAYVYAPDSPSINQQLADFTQKAVKSKALGFQFNSEPVKSEYPAVMNVVSQYVPGLETGSIDPDKVLPEFIAKLKAAGIDKIINEKQKQLDEWAKNNK